MPNFEMYGFENNSHVELADQIADFCAVKPYNFIITVIQAKVFDNWAVKQPFIRLVSTPGAHTEKILEFLQTLGVDVEFLELHSFYPKK